MRTIVAFLVAPILPALPPAWSALKLSRQKCHLRVHLPLLPLLFVAGGGRAACLFLAENLSTVCVVLSATRVLRDDRRLECRHHHFRENKGEHR